MVVILAAIAEVPVMSTLSALTAALMSAMPVTTKALRPLTAPLKMALAATVRSWLFPVRLLLKVMLLPDRIIADAASSVTAPVYV